MSLLAFLYLKSFIAKNIPVYFTKIFASPNLVRVSKALFKYKALYKYSHHYVSINITFEFKLPNNEITKRNWNHFQNINTLTPQIFY